MIKINGTDYPVTTKFQAEILDRHPELNGLNYADLIEKRDALLRLSTARNNYQAAMPEGELATNGTLSVEENTLLDNIVHVINVHNAVNFLRGRSIVDFGFDGIDQIHGNESRFECGCITSHIFDHHKAKAGETVEIHPHFPRRHCAAHVHLKDDFKAHFAAVHADNKKNTPLK